MSVALFIFLLIQKRFPDPSLKTRGILNVVRTALEDYYQSVGQYPEISCSEGRPNAGSRVLYRELFSGNKHGFEPAMRNIGAIVDSPEGPLVVDGWGSPIVYFDYRSYSHLEIYIFRGKNVSVCAIRDHAGHFLMPNGYQVFSIGDGGKFSGCSPREPIWPSHFLSSDTRVPREFR